jgi:lipopolysaccharide transport system permease protein
MNATDGLPKLACVSIVYADEPVARPSLRHTLGEMIGELWQCRELLWQMTRRDLRVRYKQALLGAGWALLLPGLVVLAGLVLKLAMAQVAGASLSSRALAGIALKALPWGLFVGAAGFATTSLTNNLQLVTKIYFPREVFPLSCLLTQLADTGLGSIVAGGLLLLLGAVPLTPALAWLLPLALLTILLTAGACLFLSCANLFFRDVRHLAQLLLTFGIFFTPVFFDAADLGPTGCPLLMLNPLAVILEGLRLAALDGHNLLETYRLTSVAGAPFVAWHPWYLAYVGMWAGPVTLAAWLLFHHLEPSFAEHV